MSVDSATNSKKVPLLLLPHQDNEDINYMRHTLKEWDIGKLKDPIYFYQPTVRPNSQGGVVRDTYTGSRKNKEFFEVRKEYIKRPEAENWMMYTSDGVLFRGSPDTLTHTAVIYPRSEQFAIQTANISIRIKDGKDLDSNIDIDTAEKRRKQEAEAKTRDLKKNLNFIYVHMEKKEKERQNQAKELRETGDEDIAIGGSDEGDDNKDEDAFNNDENAADVEDARSDDDEDLQEDLDNLFTEIPEELNQIHGSSDEEESQSSYDEDSEGEEGGTKKKKKKKKGHNQAPEQQEAAHPEGQEPAKPQSTEKIVDDVLGPKVIKEDELVRYMMDVGYVTLKQMWDKFKDRLTYPEQKMAFKQLIIKKLQQFTDNGVKYVKLKDKK